MTELVWEGKYKDGKKVAPVRIALPFQSIETVNESAQERQRSLDLFASGRESEWRNRLIWGDKKYVLPSLLPEFAGKVNLIYIDPPFDTGADFSFTATIPDDPDTDGDETTAFTKQASILEQKAYRDTWGRGLNSYVHWFYETVVLLHELLHETGSLFVHCDWRITHHIRWVLQEVFGDAFINEIVWRRSTSHSDAQKFGQVHDIIYWFSRGPSYTWNPQFRPYSQEYIDRYFRFKEPDGRRYWKEDATGAGSGPPRKFGNRMIAPPPGRHWRWTQETIDDYWKKDRFVLTRSGKPEFKRYLDEQEGEPVSDVWDDIKRINMMANERLDYPTQKPEGLLERLINASSNEGDLVLDCFVGSGTTAAVAEKLNRRWIGCDLGRFAIHTTRKRLLGLSGVRPFVVQNLGKYERQEWQAAEFASPDDAREREARYRKFILELYHASPISGYTWIHGTKSGRMIHIGAVDAPVTLSDVKSVAAEVWRSVGKGKDAPKTAGVDILGWEFALEVNELAKQVAAEAHVDVVFKKIPREVLEKKAVEQGDIKFFELAALSVKAKQKGRDVTLRLHDFVVPPDDVPEDVRRVIKHWSQWIDYWAVDWDYKEDTFHNQWQSYRTRKNPELEKEAAYTYKEAGQYTAIVKVIDILGNDTTTTVRLEAK
jgi:adenine-specific DNA-methyltransferase